jgi:phage/plasmid primase-like uncharacterized protein
MGYMTMKEQIASHLAFLKEQNFAVDNLYIDSGFIRCSEIGHIASRGEFCYQTKTTQLDRGLIGLATWLRGIKGQVKIHKTYGLQCLETRKTKGGTQDSGKHLEAVENARIFWEMSDQVGQAEYLIRKGVGYYGIRFRRTDYGEIAVIPLRDTAGKVWSYQLINPDGTKRFAKDVEIKGLLHILHQPIEGASIGLTESYVAAASCFEITGLAMVTAFTADNLKIVGKKLRKKFPSNPIIVFGDNDRHLEENKGKKAAYAVLEELRTACQIAIPEFDAYPALRDFSDWNDYVREKGVKETRFAIQKTLEGKKIPKKTQEEEKEA